MNTTHPILSCEASIALENRLLGSDEAAIGAAMTRAGRMLGQAIMRDFQEINALPERANILVLAGKGHNAGDAMIAADEILRFNPYATVHIVFAFGQEALRPLVRQALEALEDVGRVLVHGLDRVDQLLEQRMDICIDGLLGMQFRPPVGEPLLRLLEQVNTAQTIRFRAAVDLPSGYVFNADITYATGIAKAPLFDRAHAAKVGRIRYLDIGFFEKTPDETNTLGGLLLPDILKPLQSMRDVQTHKRHFGHLFVLAGSRHMPGAALMAVQAALRSGVGLVTAFVPESLAAHFAAQAPEAMWVAFPETPDGALALEGVREILQREGDGSAILAGPGMGREPETQALLMEVVSQSSSALVLDADALQPQILKGVSKRSAQAGSVCITPHAGEFARLCPEGEPTNDVLMKFARTQAVNLLFKGAATRITEGHTLSYSTFGNPVLARGGSGDVLAGLLGGLLAQKPDEPLLAMQRAAVWHGLAADALARAQGQHAATALDLLPHLCRVLRDWEC